MSSVVRNALRHHRLPVTDNVVVPSECQKPSVLEFCYPGVDSGNPVSMPAFAEVRRDIDAPAVRTVPAVPAVIGYVKNRTASDCRGCVAWLENFSVRCHDCAGYDLIAGLMFRIHELRLRPGPAVVGTCPEHAREVLPCSRSFHSVEMIQNTVCSVIVQGRPRHVPVRHLEEQFRLCPFGSPGLQTA